LRPNQASEALKASKNGVESEGIVANFNSLLTNPGLLNCSVQGTRADDSRPGLVNISVEPDLSTKTDAIIKINDHFDAPTFNKHSKNSLFNAKWAVAIMLEDFELSINRSTEYTNTLINNFLEVKNVDNGGIK